MRKRKGDKIHSPNSFARLRRLNYRHIFAKAPKARRESCVSVTMIEPKTLGKARQSFFLVRQREGPVIGLVKLAQNWACG